MTTLNNVVLFVVVLVLASFVGSVVPVPFVSDGLSVVVEAQDRGDAYNCAEVMRTGTTRETVRTTIYEGGVVSAGGTRELVVYHFSITNRCEYVIIVHYTANEYHDSVLASAGDVRIVGPTTIPDWDHIFRHASSYDPDQTRDHSFRTVHNVEPELIWCAERPRGFDTTCQNPRRQR